MNRSEWAHAVQVFEQLQQHAPEYGDSADLLHRARQELQTELDSRVVSGFPGPFRALLFCILYELQPDRFAEYLPKLADAIEDPGNPFPPETILANIAGILGFRRVAEHLKALDSATRERLIKFLAPVFYESEAYVSDESAAVMRELLSIPPPGAYETIKGDLELVSDDQAYVILYDADRPEKAQRSMINDLTRHNAMVLQDPAVLSQYVLKDLLDDVADA
jgi:hypothetical protein